ncbi:HRDC domain containing protein [Trichomonas vaginalis G3]|uniref:HRDC domain containing protein n=1 Tax=Trichomonas vaginalis (strain ATCC PRA-98 / G3) TaxID=412133 RepID=A2EJK5_TRIV3|nr:3'-5' exonuclease protein [Trichomonas vaginalis G3]EAY07175.1 HRDC domain containing protein [Trichomonas vaginalis G3]KAI5503642.1 3'-5' exonuclease protein [Trichomonas vaginalis G3]|eukprot:XP_001319398.1 HRDC domain containing protein [Trichomonas vaginalis G3]
MIDVDDLITALKDLTETANKLPVGTDYSIETLDDSIMEKLNSIQAQVIYITQLTVDFIDPINDDINKNIIENRCELAITKLLDSSFINEKQNVLSLNESKDNDIIEEEINGRIFYYSKSIAKPLKYNSTYSEVPQFPQITFTPDFLTLCSFKSDFSYQFIDKEEDLKRVIFKLKSMTTLFISIEIHRVRTYIPFPCLIVLYSPYVGIFIIDLLKLRCCTGILSELLYNKEIIKIFFDKELFKIMHESLGIYVYPYVDLSLVNTQSLEHIFKQEFDGLCVVDWRIRPFTDELINIAVRRVNVLPKITIKSKIDLNIINKMNVHEKEEFMHQKFTKEMARELVVHLCSKFGNLNSNGLKILEELLLWRDEKAYLEDESPNFIALDKEMWILSYIQPMSSEELISCLGENISPYLKEDINGIVGIIKNRNYRSKGRRKISDHINN